jgi:hypothetical protein
MRPHRRVHFAIWIVLALVLPALFIAGLAVRRSTTPPNPHHLWER